MLTRVRGVCMLCYTDAFLIINTLIIISKTIPRWNYRKILNTLSGWTLSVSLPCLPLSVATARTLSTLSGHCPNIDEIKLWGAIYGALLRPCVPLFVMITGALLLPVRGEVSVFIRNVSPCFMAIPHLVGHLQPFPLDYRSVGHQARNYSRLFPLLGEEVMRQSLSISLDYIAQIPFNFSIVDVHMWYIYLLIGLYLYLPVFSAWVEKASDKAKLWFLGAWAVTLLLPYYNQFVAQYLWGTCSWNAFGMFYYFAGFNGYLLLGHYLRNLDWTLGKILAIGLPMFVIGYAVTFFGFRYITALPEYSDEMLELFFTYCSLNVVMMTIPVFMLCKK